MAQTTYTPPDWGAALNAIDAALAAGAALDTDIVSYSIAGRSFTKSREETMKHRAFVYEQYTLIVHGNVTLVDGSGQGWQP
jgi:hypothetical protein